MADLPASAGGLGRLRLLPALVASASGGGGLFLALHHPLWPIALAALFVAWSVTSARWPGLWLVALPAAVPLASLSPWTGWLIFDEFDLLVLGSLAGGFARMAVDSSAVPPNGSQPFPSAASRGGWMVPTVMSSLALLGLFRGLADAGTALGWFDGYADAANSLRLSKSLLCATALWPLLQVELQRSTPLAMHRLTRGIQVGLALVGLTLLGERDAYPGLLDFSARYRTVAAFWEMHVGGAAIDVYLALATPFAAWALVSARSRLGWATAAALALLTGHACLTTFSRGAYVGVAVPLILLGAALFVSRPLEQRGKALLAAAYVLFASASAVVLTLGLLIAGYAGISLTFTALLGLVVLLRVRRFIQWRRAAALALTLALLAEVVAVIGGGTLMRSRLDASQRDWGARLAHWRSGLTLLRTPADWLLGIGAGRLPWRYATYVPGGEFSGAVRLSQALGSKHVLRLWGPATVDKFAGLYSLTQRISLLHRGIYQVELRVRTAMATTVALDVCEQHLLYSRECQGALVSVEPSDGRWQSVSVLLEGPALDSGHWYAPRLGLFSVSIRDTGTSTEFSSIALWTPDGTQLLANGDFSAGKAHWFPVAQSHFLPWHIDNLYLELLIEHGVLGLVAFLALMALTFKNLVALWRREVRLAPFLAAPLLGTLLVGCVSSVLDVPRLAFLLLLISILSLQAKAQPGHTSSEREIG